MYYMHNSSKKKYLPCTKGVDLQVSHQRQGKVQFSISPAFCFMPIGSTSSSTLIKIKWLLKMKK